MEQKELNFAICKELERIAKEVFDNEILVMAGSYSISELASNKTCFWIYNPECMIYDIRLEERPGVDRYNSEYTHEELDEQGRIVRVWNDNVDSFEWIYGRVVRSTTIKVDEFSCEIPRGGVFCILNQFYSLAGVGTSKRMILTKEETMGEVSLDADFTLTKDILNLTPFCKDNTLDAYFKGKIWIDLKRQCAVSTNGHTLAFTGCEAMLNSIDDGIDEGFAIDAKEIKRLNGKCHAVRTTIGKENYYIVTDENGVTVKTPANARYPRWNSVIPKPLDAAVMMVDTKKMVTALRSVKSTVDYKEFVAIHADIGDSHLTLKTDGGAVAVPLTAPANHDVRIGMKYSQLVSEMSQCDGRLYIYGTSRAMMFGRKNGGLSIAMPMLYENCPKRCEDVWNGSITEEEIQSACHHVPGTGKKVSPAKVQPTSTDASAPLTPVLKQFYDLKKKHPDALLLFRCGNFYETYCEDAVAASKVLAITLTRSNKSKEKDGKPLRMAGFPYHVLDTYLPKLIRAGHRVAICDQIETKPTTIKVSSDNHITDAGKKVRTAKVQERPTARPSNTEQPTPAAQKPSANIEWLYSRCDKATLEIVKAIMAA